MAHTNQGRVILGGLLAGAVINVVEFITNGVVLREAWGRAMQALGKPAELPMGAIVIFNIWGFLARGSVRQQILGLPFSSFSFTPSSYCG